MSYGEQDNLLFIVDVAGVFMSSGEQAVASNIVPGTHRIQRWDFRRCQIPDLTKSELRLTTCLLCWSVYFSLSLSPPSLSLPSPLSPSLSVP